METIIILALVFFFVGLRLYSVLGRRTGHEQTIAKPVEAPIAAPAARPRTEATPAALPAGDGMVDARARDGIRAIVAVDPSFDPGRFLGGAEAAYRLILEAFWRGDEEELAKYVDADVQAAFGAAIAERKAAGHVIDNRLITVERATIDQAELVGQTANVTVRFEADMAAVTRDAEDVVVAGSLSDAIQTHDVWTFARNVRASDPNWILVETDEAA